MWGKKSGFDEDFGSGTDIFPKNPTSVRIIEKQAILDTERDHYLLLHTGWCNNRRTHGCSLHIDIKDGKIWIQHDGSEAGIATQLLELGVPKENIVLAFHSPYMREFTEFATQ